MDTGSHLLFGLTLAGLAYLDPAVSQNPEVAQAVMVGTLLGSHAPDFDTLVRLRGFSFYVRHHRGITHSIPALFIWPLMITLPLLYVFGMVEYWFVLYFWTFLSIFLHVFLDALNTYGVQCLRPIIKKWIHLDILNLFEPILFFLHAMGTVLWLFFHFDPISVFPAIYCISILYVIIRFIQHYFLIHKLMKMVGLPGTYHLFPSFHWFHWRFVVESEESFYVGTLEYGRVFVKDVISNEGKNPVIEATKSVDGVRAFLEFAQRVHVSCMKLQDGYEVQWSDVRFWYNHKLTFGVDIKLDQNLKVVSQHFGWRKKALEPPFV